MRKFTLIQLAPKICRLIGARKYTKWQSQLKFWLNFRDEYNTKGKLSRFNKQTYVFMVDGKTKHGGLSDRLRGAFSVYSYCKKHNFDFKICWDYPFKLQDYLTPAQVMWICDRSDLSFNSKDVDFKFFNSYCCLNNGIEDYYNLLKSNKKEVHVYSNVTIEENRYKDLFNELFKPTDSLRTKLDQCQKKIDSRYISVTFRFIGLLGDFKDDYRFLNSSDDNDAKFYIDRCKEFICRLHTKYPNYKVLITSDSSVFLKEACAFSFVYIIPGELVHMDNTKNTSFAIHQKTFLDLMMISDAEIVFSYCVGSMYRNTRFAMTAALIGGKDYCPIYEQ